MDSILKAQLSRDEGRELKAYRDSNGYWTIGVGHLLGSSPRMSSITDAECDTLLAADVEVAIRSLQAVFGSVIGIIDPPRFHALVNMMFNRGEEHVRQSTTITPAIKAALVLPSLDSGWKAVSDAILASPWAQQIGQRAVRLAKQLETGVDQ